MAEKKKQRWVVKNGDLALPGGLGNARKCWIKGVEFRTTIWRKACEIYSLGGHQPGAGRHR
eukprot:11202721-Lingulodinium_polyedra.AAC.1